MASSRLCSVDGCGKPTLARGWCGRHWGRWRTHGDPMGGGTSLGEPMRFFREVVLTDTRGPDDPCLIWPYSNTKGYGTVRVDGQPAYVHRMTCEEAHGPAPTPKHEAAHSCGKGSSGCVTKGHLRWATSKENHADKLEHGTVARGECNGMAKLIEADVLQIRALASAGVMQKVIADRIGISRSTVCVIVSKKSWGWL